MDEDVDVVVVGMGPGGEEVAGRLAEAGLDVVGVEPGLVGGECPYWGCIPSKIMVRSADLVAEARRGRDLTGPVDEPPVWRPVVDRVRDATDGWDDAVAVHRFGGKGGRLRRGAGRLDGPGRVVVDDLTFVARRGVVLATGSRPTIPSLPGLDGTPYWTNREAVMSDTVPESLLVLGGGAVGLELAQVYRRFGAEVTVLDTAPRLLIGEEPESGDLIAEVLESDGITLHLGIGVSSVYHDGSRFTLVLDGGEALGAEHLLVATGRHADLAALHLSSIGIDEELRAVPVDERLRVPGVEATWAVGDLTGKGAFTHTAMYQGDLAVRDILGQPAPPADYRAMPRVTFTDPEVGAVGMTERAAREAGLSVRVGSTDLSTSARGWIHGAGQGLIKLVADADRGVLVGATSIGPDGGEVLGLLALAVHAAVPVPTLADMIYAYPTFHRAIQDAVRDLDLA